MEQFQIGCLLKMITDKIKMRADADLAQQGLTLTQSRVLGYLDRSGGQATQKEIEGFLQVSHPTVAGIINRMEQNGFVRCRLDPADKRSKIVSQTERAAAVAQDMHATIQTTEQQMLRSLMSLVLYEGSDIVLKFENMAAAICLRLFACHDFQ